MRRVVLWIFLPLVLVLAGCNSDPEAQAKRYTENGNKFFDKEKYKEASIMYRRALQKNGRYGEAHYRLALTQLRLADYGAAYKSLRRTLELLPDNTDAPVRLAELVLLAASQGAQNQEQLLEEANEMADKLLAKDANDYDGHRILGQLALLKRDFPVAAKELGIAHSFKPDQAGTALAYFQALASNGQFEEAEKLGLEVIAKQDTYAPMYDLLYLHYATRNRLPDAQKILERKVEGNPTNGSFVLQLAAHYYLTQRRPEMEAMMQRLADEEKFPNGRLMAGDFYFLRLREFDRARQEYEAGVKAFPEEASIYRKRLVELFAQTNRKTDANSLLKEILDDNPDDDEAVAMRAALRLTTGSREEVNMAATELQALVTKTPDNHLLRFNLARALVAKGSVGEAQIQLDEAIKRRPDFVAARELLSRIYLSRQEGGKALKEADEIIARDPRNLQAHLSRSSALLLMNERDKAHQELEFITKTYPQNAEARFQVGYLAWQEKDFARAAQVFGELRQSNPNDLRGLVGVVETMAGQNNMAGAIAEIEKAVQTEPDRRDLRLALANLLVRDQKYDRAIGIFNELLAKDPKASDLLFRIAETYRRKGDLNTAIEKFRASSDANPNDTNSLLQLGLLMDGTGRRDQAKPIYEQILRINPDHPIALNNLAFIKAEEGVDLDQAMTMAQKARQVLPNSPDIADTLGWIFIKKNLTEDAIRMFTDLVRTDPKNPSFRYHYAMALFQKGDRPAARRELEEAMKNGPSQEERAAINTLMRQL